VVVAAVGVGGFGTGAVEGLAWWWPQVADALLCCFFQWWIRCGGGPPVAGPVLYFFCFFSFVCHACQREAHDKDLIFAVRLQSRRTTKLVAAVLNGLPLGNFFFCRAWAMTHGKGYLSCM
jgi:hypothetical protein